MIDNYGPVSVAQEFHTQERLPKLCNSFGTRKEIINENINDFTCFAQVAAADLLGRDPDSWSPTPQRNTSALRS